MRTFLLSLTLVITALNLNARRITPDEAMSAASDLLNSASPQLVVNDKGMAKAPANGKDALASILSTASAVYTDSLYIDPFEITVGETKEVSINLTNSQNITAFQAELFLPNGLSIVKQDDEWMSLTSRAASDHSLVVNSYGSGTTKIVCFSNTNSSFSENEGALITMQIKAGAYFTGDSIKLSNIILSDESNQDIKLDSSACMVSAFVPVTSLNLSQDSVEIKAGNSIALTAYINPWNATDKTVKWTSGDERVATVDSIGTVTAVSLGETTITATCDSLSATCAVTVVANPATRLIQTIWSQSLKVGEQFTFSVTVEPENATDKTVTWSSDNEAVATVDSIGTVTAVALGNAKITASCGDVTASCNVNVVATPAESVTLSQETAELKVGETVSLSATVLPEDATDKTVTWTSYNSAVATVDSIGNVTAISVGTAEIIARTSDWKSATCTVTVVPTPVDSITISQKTAELKVNETLTLTTVVFPETATDKKVKWTSSNSGVASIDDTGIVKAISLGETKITATCGEAVDSCMVMVIATPVDSITLSQYEVHLAEGETVTLKAKVNPETATDKIIIWTTDNDNIATVDNNGAVKAVGIGSANITATASNNVSASCKVIVDSSIIPVKKITLSKSELTLVVGDSATLTASIEPLDATYQDITWKSSDESVATISADGAVTTLKAGYSAITASTANGVSATCHLNVVSEVTEVTGITIEPKELSLNHGTSKSLSVRFEPYNATFKTVVWTSSDDSIASVNEKGDVTGVSVGETTIIATCGEVADTCTVTVVPTPVNAVSISDYYKELKVGEQFTLSATVSPDNATDKSVTWTSSNEAVATVDANGVVTAISEGTAIITAAASNGVSASCTVTVKALVVEPEIVLAESLSITPDVWTGEEGSTFSIAAVVLPENATDKTLLWESSDVNVATVDSIGNVSVLKEGTCVITVSTADGSELKAQCTITSLAGIDLIFSESDAKVDVYNLNGILIRKECTREDLKQLTPAIYILRQGGKVATVFINK